MRKSLCIVLSLCAVLLCGGAAADAYLGIYEGVYQATGRADTPVEGVIVSEGPALYRASLHSTDPAQPYAIEVHGHLEGPMLKVYGQSSGYWWDGEARDGKLVIRRGERHYGGAFSLQRVERRSPTEGMAPPEGAVVVLPFKPGQKPSLEAWTNQEWKPLNDGSMEVKPHSGNSHTKDAWGDMSLHFEFNLPHMPNAQGQGRSNSGLYIQGRYEVQVLDSFGVLPGSGDCGGVYQVAAPMVNASLPPGQWQTYDIDFQAPRLGADGKQTKPAVLTVRLNGVVIQDKLVLDKPTPGGVSGEPAAEGPILLQDHGNNIRFRNVWVVPR